MILYVNEKTGNVYFTLSSTLLVDAQNGELLFGFTTVQSSLYLLQDGSSYYLLEDGFSRYILE